MMTPGSHTLTGHFAFHPHFGSQHLGLERDIIIFLPPGYHVNTSRRYPVLYLQDGQNLFDAATSFAGGEMGRGRECGTADRVR